VLELEHVAQQRAVGFGILAVDDGVRAGDFHPVPPHVPKTGPSLHALARAQLRMTCARRRVL